MIVNSPGTYNFVKIRTLDLSGEFETQPTVEQLRSKAETYIQNNNIGVPVVSWSVSFEQLTKSEEYKHLALLERVSLFDTVNVEFPALGVSATAKAVKVVYDSLADRVKSVTLGSVRANIADTIANQQTEIDKTKEKPSLSMVQKISSALAKAIMGANGGSVRLIDTNEDGDPDELYIADNSDPLQAVKVWRFNYNGWAASKNGYSGPFEFGATLEDGLLANFVTAAQLVAGTIKSQDDGETFFLDLDNGILKMKATEFSIEGKTIPEVIEESPLRESIAQILVDSEGITERVGQSEEIINTLTGEVESTKQEILEIQRASNQLSIDLQKVTDDGVDKVATKTGFTFNEVGLNISKSTSDISTQITEDGMTINRNDEALLTADHEGVEAKDLHAKTYLIIGGRSRFENYGSDRTGCFWIGEE